MAVEKMNKKGKMISYSCGKAAGYTLVELVVVLVVVSIVAGVSISNFSTWFGKGRVDGASNQLFTELHKAKMKAISENTTYTVVFDIANHKYTINGTPIVINDFFEDIVFGFIDGTRNTGNTDDLDSGDKAVDFGSGELDVCFSSTGFIDDCAGGSIADESSIYLMPNGTTNKYLQRAIMFKTNKMKQLKYNGTTWE